MALVPAYRNAKLMIMSAGKYVCLSACHMHGPPCPIADPQTCLEHFLILHHRNRFTSSRQYRYVCQFRGLGENILLSTSAVGFLRCFPQPKPDWIIMELNGGGVQ